MLLRHEPTPSSHTPTYTQAYTHSLTPSHAHDSFLQRSCRRKRARALTLSAMLGVPLSASPVKVGIIVAREISKEEQEKQAEQGWLATCVKAHCSSLVNRSFCNPNHPPKHTQHIHLPPLDCFAAPLDASGSTDVAFSYLCRRSGDPDTARYFERMKNVHSTAEAFSFTCPSRTYGVACMRLAH